MSASALEVNGRGSAYTDEQRTQAAIQYAIKGNLKAIEQELSIPRRTIYDWSKQDWFIEMVTELRQENQNEHIAQYHELTREALGKALTGVQALDGSTLSPSDIKALVVTGATATDKARLLMNLPTSISSKQDGMAELAAKFEELSQNHRNIQASVVATVDKPVDNSEA